MKQVMRFSVDGQTVDVPRDELEEFQAAAADHGAKPDEVQGIRVTGADGRAQDVEVPTSEMGDFEAAALEHGATFEPMRTVKMNDGSVRKMSVGELSQFLRSDAYLKSDDHKETVSQLAQRGLDEGSVGWSRVGGFFRGLGYGAWQGAEAAADKIAKAIPETALDIDAAAGHVLKGVSKLGDNAVTRSIGRLGEATVQSATAAKAWLNEKIGSSTGDRLGYEDWSTAFSDFIGDVAGMAYKFAPGMSTGAPMGAKAVATMDAKARAALGAKVVAESGGRILPKAGALAKIAPTDLMGNAVAVSKLQKIGAYARAALGGNFGAYMETVFGSDGINAYAAMYDAAIENGMTPRQAAKIGGEAFLLNYFGGRVMMRAGGMADGIKSPMWRFLAGGEAISDVMALQAAGNKGLENEATGRPVTEGMGGALWDGKMEGLLFHGLNAVPGAILQKVENREAWLRHERWRRGFILDMLKEGDGAAELYTMMSSDKLDAAIRARREVLARQEPTAGAVGTEQGKPSVGTEQGKTAAEQGKAATGAASGATAAGAEQGKASAGTGQGKAATGAKKKVDFVRLAIAAGVPEVMSRAEMNNLVDVLARQRDALNERVRLQMSDERAEALSATIDGPVKALLDEKRLDPKDVNDVCARIWLKASEKITDASSLDDPDFRQKLVESATREVVGEMSREKQVQADERSRLRGAPVSAQVGEIEERHITSWEDAEADGLIGKDEKGRWTGGMRQALNIAINGTDRLKAEVRDGKMDGEVAEDLISAAYCELGGRPSDERALLVDRVLDFADGNAESARRLMDKIAAQERSSDVPLLDELKRLEDEVTREMEAGIGAWADGPEAARPPQTAYEGAANAERLKGTELKSRDGGVMGCQRFPEVRVEISQEGIRVDGLTDDLISRPENAADAAALLKRLNDIAERNGLTIDLRDANAKAAADALLDEINRGGLEAAQAKLDTRAKLFGLLFKTTLGNGVTYDEASFRAALKKTSNGRPFIDRHGNIYGMTDGEGVVHFNPAALNFNTPIHEYGHLALEAIRGINPALWQRGKELVRNSDYFKEIKGSSETEGNEYAYLKGRDDAICDEALATLIGDRGERLVEGTRLGAELKAWLKEVWKAFKGALGLADLTEEQIERMTLGEFVDAVNAELLKGSEFGTRKRAPLSKVAIRRYDETDGSGSNGLLRWKNDRGYLFALPVDMARTQPGGRVVLARDDANVTDWIERRLAGLELRLSESGKVYVKGRNGFEGELADVFGRYPTIGQNDGLAAQIAQETGRAEWAGATAEELVAGLAKDRASYGAWAEARAAGTGADALAAREEAAARAEAEGAAERRWQDSGMGVVEYIRDMAERGEPGFDLDWETAREIERERTQGLLKNLEEVGLMHAGAAARAAATGQGAGPRAQGEAKFSVVGARGAGNLGVKGMADAERMEKDGADRTEVWRKTGWWRGVDGKWRFELPRLRRMEFEHDPETRHFTSGGYDFYRYRLTELIRDCDLFKAYPEMRNVVVEFHAGLPKGFQGVFDGATLTIKLPQKFLLRTDYTKWDLGDGKSSQLNEAGLKEIEHEVQHAVQLFEGLAVGGSPSDSDIGQYIRLAGEVEARNVKFRAQMTPEERAATPPWETEDVPAERQIVRGFGSAVQFSVGRKREMSALAKAKVGEWVEGVTPDSLRNEIKTRIAEGVKTGDYRFKRPGDRTELVNQAVRFFRRFSTKTVMLSDGRCVYFVPDARSRARGLSNEQAWAEYAIHAVTSSGSKPEGKGYHERLFNPTKAASLWRIENVLKAERCAGGDRDGVHDRVEFYGKDSSGKVMRIVTRFDEAGNIYADLAEVTILTGGKEKNLPPLKSLREVVEAAQERDALPTANANSVSNRGAERNGGAGLAPRAQDGGTSAAARAAATGQGAGPRAQGGTPRAQGEAKFSVGRLYTGSAADYEKPSLHAVGTGEGSQVYGWGLYASNRRGVAEGYANLDAKHRASTPDEMWPKYKGKFDSELEHDPVRTFALKYVAREGSVDAAIQFLRTDDWTERAAPKAREAAEWLEKNRDDVTPPQTPSEHLYEQTWFTDRAPGDESHLLKWYEPVSEEQLKWIEDGAKEFSANDRAKFARVLAKPLNYNTRTQYGKKPLVLTGEDIYRAATHIFEYGEARARNPQKAASEFLARAGIDGVKYPVDSYGGKAVKDGEESGWNYVSFRDDNIRVDHKWTDGEAVFHVGRVNPKLREDIREAIAGDAKGNPIGRRKEVSFSEMPATLKAVGLPDLPIRTRTDIVRKLKREHRFTEQQIAALPAAYGQPVAVFADGKAFVILTEMQIATRKGTEKPVMVVLRENVDRNGRHEFLASAYPREEANENFYWGLARNGGMLFLDKNKVAVIGLSGRTISTLNKQADGNRVKTPEDLSSLVSGDSIANSAGGGNGGAGLAPRAQDGGTGAAARAAATGQGAGPRAQDGTTRVQGEGRGATGQGEGRFSVGPGGPGRALVNKALFVAGRARVADDAGVGEQTPGSLALSRELSTQGVTPLSQLGTLRKISLPISAMEFVRKRLTGDAAPAAVVRRLPGGRAAAHTAAGRLYISADIYGTVDKSDMAKEKARLKAHGFFRNEDPGWCATQYPAAIRAEQKRSDDALANQLDNLGSRRARGLTDGGQAAATQVFADELARIVLEMPQQTAGVLGSVQTIGKSVRTEALRRFAPSAGAHGTGQNGANAGQGAQGQTAEAAARAEAGGFLDWSYGGPLTDPATGSSVSRGDVSTMGELANAMFGKWLVMPREMETRAPTWSQVIEATIANDPRLKDAFEEVSRHFTTEQASGYLVERIRKQQSKDTEAALKKLQWEARNPIGAGSIVANAKEGLFVGFHDKFAPVTVRISQKLKDYKAAQKALLRRTPNAADRAAIRAETDRFIGEVEQRLHRLELSRTAYERGAFNEGNRYFLEMLRLEGKASERWGLTEEDRSLYLRLQRVIETQGRAASDGMSARQAQIALDEMKTRLGAAKYAKLEQYGREFFDIHRRYLLDDRRMETTFGKTYVDYLRTQERYTATIRTLSVDEIAAVNAARAAARAAGVAGGDDMVSAVYAYASSRGAGDVCGEAAWTMPMKGSMAAAQEARSATWMKVDRLMHFLRRNQMMIDLRDALLKAGVEGVRDLRRTDGAEWPDNERYGHLNYMVDGEKRTLVVPRQIADAFRVDPDAAQWITKANGLVRALYIDYNPAYWAQNVKRNQDSIEKNMPGMRETYAKTALRAVAPGMGAASDLVLQALVRNVPQAGCLFNRHTVYAHIPKAERYARILEKTVEWQRELWAAEDAGDVAKVLQMNEDFAGVMEMLKGNFLVPMAQAYRGPETNGFAFEAFSRKGLKSFEQVDAENRARSKGRKLLDAINVFKKNQAQQEHEDVLAKVVAYLHDRMEYGAIRSVEESGLIVKKNVSIAEGERAGRLKRPMQQFVAQFFNMVEKGVVRHWNALRERPGETLIADGKVWMGRFIGGLFASGALMKWMLDDSDGDEEKAKAKYGFVFGYAKAFHRAYQNCSEYVKENYNITPIWNGPDGYTSIVIGGALTDEDKLIVPTADYTSGMVAHLMGIAPAPSIGKAIANSTVKAVTPDLQLAGPIVTLLRDTVEATLIDNPTDYFRGAPMYDQRLWENRNESWEMRGQFAAAVGAKLWNDFGGRSLLAMDVNGVDNGRGSAPETLESVLRRLPVVSPAIGRMIKIQVGSPAKRGATIREQEAKTRSLIGLLSEKLLKGRKGDVGWHERDFDGFQKQIEDWTKTYGFTPEDVSKLRMRYYNAWIQFKNREGYDRQELARLFTQGRKQGLSEEQLWIMLGDL